MLYKKFYNNLHQLLEYNFSSHLAISVSGGADSLALMSLMKEWAENKMIKVTILTVNHNLRKESIAECHSVKNLAIEWGFKCVVLNWDPELSKHNILARARKGRYDLLSNYCKQNNINVILTGHHLDDYIENFCMRTARKSGEFGLSSNYIYFHNNIKIIRPLYNIAKQELINYLIIKKISWVEDPSNYCKKYFRTNIRNYLTSTGEEFKKDIINKQIMIDHQYKQLNKELIEGFVQCCQITAYGFTIIDIKILQLLQYTVKLQILLYILAITGIKDHVPRARSIEEILSSIIEVANFTKNLHGCSINKRENLLIIFREFGKNIPMDIPLTHNSSWDKRFKIKTEIILEDAYVSHINDIDYTTIKKQLNLEELKKISLKNHKKILFTLPVIKKLEKIIAIPHISFYNDNSLIGKIKFLYHPEFISRFIHLT